MAIGDDFAMQRGGDQAAQHRRAMGCDHRYVGGQRLHGHRRKAFVARCHQQAGGARQSLRHVADEAGHRDVRGDAQSL
ncbi:MAG: hypothetical protein DI530_17205 [Sphingomonas sp.]|uniref:Uncharacterized protein n=1 Tax=Sphingomonas adhaesiva TaxID=28212 RepID=A0A2A4I9M9_9SPHN|nr:hypothetical protein COA07_04720 [Sphingomonas adhaesiva]PZU73622.1 MAG: hypothetical protein DI530_17205 [Sphingomonas sp.]